MVYLYSFRSCTFSLNASVVLLILGSMLAGKELVITLINVQNTTLAWYDRKVFFPVHI